MLEPSQPVNDNKSDYNYLEAQQCMIAFVKIVQKHSQLYDTMLDVYRSRYHTDNAWKQVHEEIKTKLNIDCSIDELKAKWKGIRFSFSRYVAKCNQCALDGTDPPKKYYLTDSLDFLKPHLKAAKYKSGQNIKEEVEEDDNTNESDPALNYWTDITTEIDVKSEPEEDDSIFYTETKTEDESPPLKKTKAHDNGEENDDLQFFKFILPDIANFTPKEKRKFRIGLLKLVDDIENERVEKS